MKKRSAEHMISFPRSASSWLMSSPGIVPTQSVPDVCSHPEHGKIGGLSPLLHKQPPDPCSCETGLCIREQIVCSSSHCANIAACGTKVKNDLSQRALAAPGPSGVPPEGEGRDRRDVRDPRPRLLAQPVSALPRPRLDREAGAAVRRVDERLDRIHGQALPHDPQGARRRVPASRGPGDQSIRRAGRVAPAILPPGRRRPRCDPEGGPRPSGRCGHRSLPRVLPV